MASWLTTHHGEEQAMPEVTKAQLPERDEPSGRTVLGKHDDERAFRLAYADDHAREFRKALRTARVAFLVRMAVLA